MNKMNGTQTIFLGIDIYLEEQGVHISGKLRNVSSMRRHFKNFFRKAYVFIDSYRCLH